MQLWIENILCTIIVIPKHFILIYVNNDIYILLDITSITRFIYFNFSYDRWLGIEFLLDLQVVAMSK